MALVDTLLADREPSPPAALPPLNSPIGPAGRSLAGFRLAVQTVLIAEHAASVAAWRRRQDTLLSWRTHLVDEDKKPAEDVTHLVHLIAEGQRPAENDELRTYFAGTPRLGPVMAELAEMTHWRIRREGESHHKQTVISASTAAVAEVLDRLKARISSFGLPPAAAVPPAGVAAAQVAARRIDHYTRVVLDLDENLSPLSVDAWLGQRDLNRD